MVNQGFPQFSRMQDNAHVEILKNYTIPDFVLKIIAKTYDSGFAEKGRYHAKLESMNDTSIKLLHDIFVKYKNDNAGKFTQYRFYTYVSSMYPKCEILINESIQGLQKKHKVAVAVKSGGSLVAIAENKPTGNSINKKDIVKFFDVITDAKDGEYGTTLSDAIYCSSVGFRPDALVELESLKESRCIDSENIIHFKTVNFEDNMYSTVNI
ncbi:MAG: hypothetical protein HOD60_12990 [Candidatus Nitrosopelagicus sp.]|nr:hypothetical protein [Candidatus Nitrosopelagicus sp.]